mmetsp:Transcript_35306/g.94031  ORF Transcript_35306/g.94031 Transcript_35306/m.94031 type:complete len:225 (-) Transcript_35306:964-1638(-)
MSEMVCTRSRLMKPTAKSNPTTYNMVGAVKPPKAFPRGRGRGSVQRISTRIGKGTKVLNMTSSKSSTKLSAAALSIKSSIPVVFNNQMVPMTRRKAAMIVRSTELNVTSPNLNKHKWGNLSAPLPRCCRFEVAQHPGFHMCQQQRIKSPVSCSSCTMHINHIKQAMMHSTLPTSIPEPSNNVPVKASIFCRSSSWFAESANDQSSAQTRLTGDANNTLEVLAKS